MRFFHSFHGFVLLRIFLALMGYGLVHAPFAFAVENEETAESPAVGEVSAEAPASAPDSSQGGLLKFIAPRTRDDSWHWTDPIFGKYQIQMGGFRPKFDDDLKFYEELYGAATNYGFIGSDFTPWGWFIHPAFGLRTAYYTDRGRAAKEIDAATGDVTLDESSRTYLTLVPFQFLVSLRATPFPRKWLTAQVYLGRERMYFQEVRGGAAAESMIRSAQNGITGDAALTNKGWVSGNVTGFAVSALLNPLDERSVRSMANSMGLGFVYLTLFQEKVTYLDQDRISFGRSSTGIGFSFESVR